MDLSDPNKVYEIGKSYPGSIDILINNGGLSQREAFVDCEFKVAEYMMNVNCLSPIALTKSFIDRLIKSQGQIVNILSVSA